ncbi:serine/threonine protein kinase [Frondihabitans sucicola]|uniref:non-specific serine/threonine protein kinase n=1 Tax=Frondihabitans sucicola TaxID=1268041 RepID=A0ABM8GKC4_9MICO|nr:RIO1 family regulatory kinase/ATPase [Frondihabitans sucicola]BDZ48830.1 serine/threonine protein kinase [Frondihabitans sucicola]
MTFSDDFVVPTFSAVDPDDDQRWSTWPATTPTERGPRPFPSWIVTSAAAIDTELGIVKSGKEADVFLIERAVPADVVLNDGSAAACVLAAKRYRSAETSDFHRGAQYREGRRTRNTRDGRAMARGSSHGRAVQAGLWAWAEFEALGQMFARGVAVPYPVQISGTEILMEFIGDGVTAAPRLAQVTEDGAALWPLFEQVSEILLGFARAGYAHGDLSPYNLLVHDGRVVAIDVPQLVDVVSNPNGVALLERDCRNIADWFARRGFVRDVEQIFAECLGEVFGG